MLRVNTSHHHHHQQHHHRIVTHITTALFYTVVLLLTMGAYSRPIERNVRSSDEVLMGVDFLSIMLNPNTDGLKEEGMMLTGTTTPATHPNTPQPQREFESTITTNNILSRLSSLPNKLTEPSNTKTTSDDLKETTTRQSNIPISATTLTDVPSTRKDGTVKRQAVTFVTTTEKPPTIAPITLLSLEMNTEVYIGNNRPSKTSKQSVLVGNPTAINVESKKSDFGVELSEPITLENTKTQNDGSVALEIKPEEIIARGANPDYIAQQIARIHKDRQQETFNSKRSPARARAVSYSSVVQVLPHRSTRPLDQQNNKPVETNIYSVPFDRDGQNYNENSPDYEYTQIQPDSLSGKNATRGGVTGGSSIGQLIGSHNGAQVVRQGGPPRVDPTAESKEYFVTRKYVPGDYNDSRQKQFYRPAWSTQHQVYNKTYEQPEQNWGIPETNYEQQEEQQDAGGGGISGGSRSQSEVNYEIDEASSVLSNGRIHGVQHHQHHHHHHHQQQQHQQQQQEREGEEDVSAERKGETSSQPVDDSQKIGYVVEGRNYKKYRVEERTADGFIVGEYGVVSNNDGSLRGVRYTADGTINPRLIYDALMKFLSL